MKKVDENFFEGKDEVGENYSSERLNEIFFIEAHISQDSTKVAFSKLAFADRLKALTLLRSKKMNILPHVER